ncbi:sensor histidine kinase protein (plasmid) [Rhizobium etli 8C-3]|uniref:histidine kinase n=2 Tax=Rhizobium TaxID=379 RepID=A0A4R3RGY4_9HYPH|nr:MULTISPECIES: ATP-binding protein [Rhizobium]APO79802.1 sensor histidine kinase protein [Rhizobium etli 8C-3]TCU30596.1 phospho-acceptor domain-containing protein [Rhizobium azibense]TCU41393.1 phospho-acceptor domain-containing protein [Rhizobium azibense]
MTDMAIRADPLLQSQTESSGGTLAVEQHERAMRRLASLGEMTGGIAHDLRNILAIVESGLRLAERKADQPESVRAFIAAAREGVDRGVELISQLLAFADHREPDLQVRNLNELVSSTGPFLRYGAGPGIRVRLALGSDIPSCLIDPALFDAAVLNLVLNARDAMPGGGEIWIGTERLVATNCAKGGPAPGTYARLRVKDHGCGMPQDVLQKVLDPFFTTKGENGTGMGLAQVRTFMQMVGGHLSIASERGTGTTVDLLFPLPDAAA